MTNSEKILVLVEQRENQGTRKEICEAVCRATGTPYTWKNGDSLPLMVTAQNIQALRDAGLIVTVAEVTE